MGRPKPSLPWADTTLVWWQIVQLKEAGVDDIIVVLGHYDVSLYLDVLFRYTRTNGRAVINTDYRDGRATSLKCGAQALRDETEAVVILNVDQPRPAWVTRRLLEAWQRSHAAIVEPRCRGHGGHPLVVDGRLIPELRAVTEAELGLRAVTDRHAAETEAVAFENPVVLLDVNTPSEYEAALADFEAGRWGESAGPQA